MLRLRNSYFPHGDIYTVFVTFVTPSYIYRWPDLIWSILKSSVTLLRLNMFTDFAALLWVFYPHLRGMFFPSRAVIHTPTTLMKPIKMTCGNAYAMPKILSWCVIYVELPGLSGTQNAIPLIHTSSWRPGFVYGDFPSLFYHSPGQHGLSWY